MERFELAAAVAVAEDPRCVWCDMCKASSRFDADVFAMVASGLQRIGVITTCADCSDDRIVCHYCGGSAIGGAEFWQHIHDVHGDVTCGG